MNLFDISLKLNRYPIEQANAKLKQVQGIAENDYDQYLSNAKTSIVEYHLNHNKFYQSLVKSQSVNEWHQIPIMTKRDLQVSLEDRLSMDYNLKQVYTNKTSGSSGDPFYFAKDKFCHAMTWAVIQDRFSWYDIDFNKALQARFYGIPLDRKGFYKERLKDKFSRRHRFSIFDLSDKALTNVLERFKSTPFDYINGYTSAIVQFAKFLERKGLILNELCPSLKWCMATSEMLFKDDRALLEKQLGVRVINEYGASELDLIAFEHPNGYWQANSETLYLEVVDEQGRVLPYGQEGRLIITSLFNKAHPFIRYDIGDIGALSSESTLKLPILDCLSGRNNDIIYLPSGKTAAGLTFYYITKQIFKDEGTIKEFVIEQNTLDKFNVIYVSDKEIEHLKREEIKKEMYHYLEPGLNITFEKREIIERSKSGKLKQFISKLNQRQ